MLKPVSVMLAGLLAIEKEEVITYLEAYSSDVLIAYFIAYWGYTCLNHSFKL